MDKVENGSGSEFANNSVICRREVLQNHFSCSPFALSPPYECETNISCLSVAGK
jgi:hypothetical protein